jgi:ribosome-binding protein aMBF1 (putative translation factor)
LYEIFVGGREMKKILCDICGSDIEVLAYKLKGTDSIIYEDVCFECYSDIRSKQVILEQRLEEDNKRIVDEYVKNIKILKGNKK